LVAAAAAALLVLSTLIRSWTHLAASTLLAFATALSPSSILTCYVFPQQSPLLIALKARNCHELGQKVVLSFNGYWVKRSE
jgi:hypothetical protein